MSSIGAMAVPVLGKATGLLNTNNQVLAAGGIAGVLAAIINYKASKFKMDNHVKAHENALNYIKEHYPERYNTEKQILDAALSTKKSGNLLSVLSAAGGPLMTASIINQILNNNRNA